MIIITPTHHTWANHVLVGIYALATSIYWLLSSDALIPSENSVKLMCLQTCHEKIQHLMMTDIIHEHTLVGHCAAAAHWVAGAQTWPSSQDSCSQFCGTPTKRHHFSHGTETASTIVSKWWFDTWNKLIVVVFSRHLSRGIFRSKPCQAGNMCPEPSKEPEIGSKSVGLCSAP